ncbi:pectinesterase precursor [Aspergillus eucalypticola CBS 122712]|uniref:Pectinesterase n=1 Tax=Aspergillus eucalypticola (strain CBS 122712 / IBT 29274) TaxID=1448314 RepID=A0A317WMR2_ASPEC|nr:pectinesterase precursor [Aspergillus eucalypticola CBS 122712]PWY85540.1 pectinesterase precursor [Aspergillus eucalypticola CBS 122712]
MEYTLPLVGHSLAIFIVSSVTVGLAIIAVALRCFVRLYILRAFGWDDALMVAALALFISLSVLCMIGTEAGVGHALADFESISLKSMNPSDSLHAVQYAMIYWWLGQMLYLWASAVAKVAIALALLRLAVRPLHRYILWSVIGTVVCIGLVFWLILLLDCLPIGYFWGQINPLESGNCLSTDILLIIAYTYSSLTMVCDFTLGIFPAALIWGLHMSPRTKVALGAILGLGAIASVAVVIRLPYLKHYADADFLYSTYQIAIWSVMETGLAIIAGSLITLRPLFRWFLDGSSSYRLDRPHCVRRGACIAGGYGLSSSTPKKSVTKDEVNCWRPDLLSVDNSHAHGVITSVSTPLGSKYLNGSRENLTGGWHGGVQHKHRVSVHRTFTVEDV